MKTHKFVVYTAAFLITASFPRVAGAFNDEAHKALSRRALRPTVSNLDTFLRTVLRYEFYPDGIAKQLQNGAKGQVQDLIAEVGAVDEDFLTRPMHHFHNHTRTWNQAGLWLCPFAFCESSIVWSQDQNQIIGGKHSWYDARKSYYDALTATSAAERKRLYAEAFTTLGHLIHLIQDAAVPAHTRDDAHLSFSWLFGLPDPDEFHYWAEGAQAVNMISGLTFPSQFSFPKSFLGNQPSDNPTYPIPTARLTDTTAGNVGSFPYETTSTTFALNGGINVTGMSFNRGLAEYSSAHFFSQDTIVPETFQFPGLSNIELRQEESVSFSTKWGQVQENRRYYYFKPGFGDTDYKLAQGTSLGQISNVPTDIAFDPMVYADYGRKLFPRAVAYSAGLIDYFFRGKIDSTLWPSGYIWVPWEFRPSSIRVENVSVKVDGTSEQGGQGAMRLVLLYSYRYADTPSGAPKYVVSHPVSVSASSTPQTLEFQFDSLPFPLTSPAVSGSHGYVYYGHLVYKGQLGQEPESVVVDSYCMYNGTRYDRWYVFEHGPALDGKPIESAYISEC
jgi:hypothetical protein